MIDRKSVYLCAILTAAFAACQHARADSVNIIAGRDNFLVENATGSWSGGLVPFLFAGNTNQSDTEDTRRALIRFSLTAIPLGSTINSASVRVHMSKSVLAGTQTFTLHRVLADWGEGTTEGSGGSGGFSTPGSATWLHRFYPNTFWTNIGGDFDSNASASLSIAGVNHYTWNSAQLVADVQNWLASPSTNFGWLLKGNEAVAVSAKRFDSRETTLDADKPTLIVNFTPPPVIGGCCLGNNVCVQGSQVACVATGGTYRGDGAACDAGGSCCVEDIDNNGTINVTDLLAVISGWGPCPPAPNPCAADINDDLSVNVTDLLAVIGAWGPCI